MTAELLAGWFEGDRIARASARVNIAAHGEHLGPPAWAVRRHQLVERIDEPYELVLDLVTTELDFELQRLVAAEVSLEVGRPGRDPRVVHGIVTRCEYVRTFAEQLHVRLLVEPALALLRYQRRRRIFADTSVPEIVRDVAMATLAEYRRTLDIAKLRRTYAPRDYCVQYDETDLEFVLRILAEEGIGIVFADDGAREVAVLFDDNAVLAPAGASMLADAPGEPNGVPVIPDEFETASVESIQYLGSSHCMRTRMWTAMAFDWKSSRPENLNCGVAYGDGPETFGTVHLFSPHRLDEGKGGALAPHIDTTERWADRVAQDARARQTRAPGASNLTTLAAGSTVEVTHHPHAELDDRYAMLEVVHVGDFPEVEAESDPDARATYHNEFIAQRLEVPVRPRLRPRRRIRGPHGGVVVGPEGEEIHTDELGRVQVRMHWDEESDGGTLPWLRVLHAWAGPAYGTMFVPRVGMQVIVDFLDGDPDRPIVVGCVYTRENLPPLMLPEEKTQTVVARSRSVPSHDGYNEIKFDDAAGNEVVSVHAQRDLRETVRAAHTRTVGASERLSVGGDRHRTVRGSEDVNVGEDRRTRIDGSRHTTIGGSEHTVVHCGPSLGKSDPGIETGCSILTVHGKRIVWAEERLELRVGGADESKIVMTPAGIEIVAPQITVNATAGAPDPGSWLRLHPTGASMEGPAAAVTGYDAGVLKLEHRGATLEAIGSARIATRIPAAHVTLNGGMQLEAMTITATGEVVTIASKQESSVRSDGMVIVCGTDHTEVCSDTKTTCEGGGASVVLAAGIADING